MLCNKNARYETKLVKNIKQEITMKLSRYVPNSPVQKRSRSRLEDVKYYNMKLHDMAIKMLQLFHQQTEVKEPEKRRLSKYDLVEKMKNKVINYSDPKNVICSQNIYFYVYFSINPIAFINFSHFFRVR